MHHIRMRATPMHVSRRLRLALGALLVSAICTPALAADPATQQLERMDKELFSARTELLISHYPPATGKPPRHAPAQVYAATLLFERPDRFRLVLEPGRKGERRIVGEAGKVRWLDTASGQSGSESAEKVIDPLILALLGSAGELQRYAAPKEVFLGKPPQQVTAAVLYPRAYGTTLVRALASFGDDGMTGLDVTLDDGSRVFVSVLSFKGNVDTKPGDFDLK